LKETLSREVKVQARVDKKTTKGEAVKVLRSSRELGVGRRVNPKIEDYKK